MKCTENRKSRSLFNLQSRTLNSRLNDIKQIFRNGSDIRPQLRMNNTFDNRINTFDNRVGSLLPKKKRVRKVNSTDHTDYY